MSAFSKRRAPGKVPVAPHILIPFDPPSVEAGVPPTESRPWSIEPSPPVGDAPLSSEVGLETAPAPIAIESERWPHTVGQLAFWFFLVPLVAMIALYVALN